MDNVISFTPAELAAFIGTIAGVCAGIATIVGIIVKIIVRLKAPEDEQNRRIKAVFVPPFSYKNNVPCQIWNT